MKSKVLFLLVFLFLSLGVQGEEDKCQGKIAEEIEWKITRDDKFTANVKFENTGEEVCNYRVYLYGLYGENENEITYRPKGSANEHVKLHPGMSGEVIITCEYLPALGEKFKIKLYHVWFPFSRRLMDESEEIRIAFMCEGKCYEDDDRREMPSYVSEADCYTSLGQACGKEASCEEEKEFEGCKDCCKEYCGQASIYDPDFEDDFEFGDDFLDACMGECGKTCDIYYEILRIENPGTDEIRVIDPAGYTRTITIYDKDCEQISGDFTDYKISDVPQCRATQEAALDFELIFPGKELLGEGSIAPDGEEETEKCEILSAMWSRSNALRGEEVTMVVKKSSACNKYETEVDFLICEDDMTPLTDIFGRDCRSWLSPDDYVDEITGTDEWVTTIVNKDGNELEGWIEGTAPPYEFYFRAFLKKDGKEISNRYSNILVVSDCVDDALLLCQGERGDNPVYGVSDATRYRKIVTKNLSGGKTKHWILDKQRYFDMDFKKCYDLDNEKNYEEYVLVDNPKYVEFAKEKFAEEPFFKKYKEMYSENYSAYLYCYKTELKDTKGCREVVNYDWYSLQHNFSLGSREKLNPEYIEEVKKWNYWQDVNERPSEESLKLWTKIFTVTPLLEDQKNNLNWTTVGNGSVYVGAGYSSDKLKGVETNFTIPKINPESFDLDKDIEIVPISENVKILKHPMFHIIERGNLKFEVTKAEFSYFEDTYKIEREYEIEDGGEFIINSDIVFNYDLLEEAEELDIKVEHKYETAEEANIVKDRIKIPQVSHSNITLTAKVSITGLIDQFVDEFNDTTISGALNVTLNPDILGVFLLEAKSAGIIYRDVMYPVKHLLSKKKSSPPQEGTNTKDYDFTSRYGYEDTEGFNFLEQCKKVCPYPQCECPLDNPLEPECLDYSSDDFSRYERNDCACLPSGCYPDPCVSNRTFHEEEGSRIVNDDFEQELEPFWEVKEGIAERELGGHQGYKLKLDGKIYQDITPATHSQPYDELCLEYEVESTSEFKVILTDGDEKGTYTICSADSCPSIGGWNKKCFLVGSNLSQIELVSEGVTYVDNVNLGKFYDFVNFQTFNISDMEYMDRELKGWDSLGLFFTDGVTHDKNSYLFEFKTLSKKYMHPKTGELLTYTLHAEDILDSTMDIYTFFRNETFPLFPARREKNLYINVTLRNASKLTLEYFPKSYMISPGSRVTVKLELTFFRTGEPIENENISLDFIGENLEEICEDPDTVDLECVTENGEIIAYVETNDMGRASFSLKLDHTITLKAKFDGNEKASPTTSRIGIPILSLKSPLFSVEFLALILIFYLAIFSYRFFQPSRADIYHWWEELKGKRL